MDTNAIVERMERMISNSSRVPGTQRRIVEKNHLDAILEDLKSAMPGEVREASEIVRQRESIISQANMEAERIRRAAQEDARSLRSAVEHESKEKLSESEVLRKAEEKGEGIVNDAQRSANTILQDAQRKAQRITDEADSVSQNSRSGADHYSREVLFNLEERLSDLLTQVRKGLDVLDGANARAR